MYSQTFFHCLVDLPLKFFFRYQTSWQYSSPGAKIAIFDQHLALGSMISGESSVANSFDRGVIYTTKC